MNNLGYVCGGGVLSTLLISQGREKGLEPLSRSKEEFGASSGLKMLERGWDSL